MSTVSIGVFNSELGERDVLERVFKCEMARQSLQISL
jgi:hypothetical protein